MFMMPGSRARAGTPGRLRVASPFSAINVGQTPTGTANSLMFYNHINIIDSVSNGSALGVSGNGFTVDILCPTAWGGARQAITGNVRTAGIISSNTAASFLVGGAFGSFALANNGGTDTGANARGSYCGINPVASVSANVTNIKGIKGMEIDIESGAGATMGARVGLDIVLDVSATGGSSYDRGLQFSVGNAASLGWGHGIMFDNFGITQPVRSSGTLIGTNGTWTVNNGIDLGDVTCSSNVLNSNVVRITGIGDFSALVTGAGLRLASSAGSSATSRVIDTGVTGRYLRFLNTDSTGVTGVAQQAIFQGGNTFDPTNYFSNTAHQFTNLANSSNWTKIDANGATIAQGAAVPTGGTTGLGIKLSNGTNFGIFFGSTVPTLSAAQGSLYLRSDGGSSVTRLYVNTNGTTGWLGLFTSS